MRSSAPSGMTLTLCAVCSSRMSYGDACDHCRRMAGEVGTRTDTLLLTPFINGADTVMLSETREFEAIPDTITVPLRDLMRDDLPPPPSGRHRISRPRRTPRFDATQYTPLLPARKVVVLIPAHNETEQLKATLTAVFNQTRKPDEVYVLLDNPVPGLAEIAAQYPVSITSTVRNKHKKAGNLNSMLVGLLPQLANHDIIMGFDADGVPEAHFIENALAWVDLGYGAIGATFHGRAGGGVLGLLQRAEFARFARHQHRKAKCDVLSGTGWAVEAAVFKTVAATRVDGMVYDVRHITEDFELTLAIRTAGIKAISPANCQVTTDVMETYRNWVSQRLRWQHGTLAALIEYGWTEVTSGMILRQMMTYLVMFATPLVAVYMIWSFLLFGWAGIDPLHAPIYALGIGIVLVEQSWQARKAGPKAIIMTLFLVPDFTYSVARQLVYIRALTKVMRKKQSSWGAGMDF